MEGKNWVTGLWEPNPDDPHNRDHANKWYYAPKSVNVDWLSGQVCLDFWKSAIEKFR